MLVTTPMKVSARLCVYSRSVKGFYGDDFIALVLFGSQARGDARADSDIDAGVILKVIGNRRAVREQLADLAYEVLLTTGENVHAIAVSQEQWRAPETFSNPSLILAMKEAVSKARL